MTIEMKEFFANYGYNNTDLNEPTKWDLNWDKMYKLAKAYYKYHGNLKIRQNYKTKNGYEYDPEGLNLGIWLNTQRQLYKKAKLSEEKITLLKEIGLFFDLRSYNWNKMYKLARAYYKYHGNLRVYQNYKTKNGYEYDPEGLNLGTWLNTQRQSYKKQNGCKLTKKQIKQLESIEMIWFTKNSNEQLQKEIITKENIIRKKKELLKSLKDFLINFKQNRDFESKKDIENINNEFMKSLERK